MSPDPIIQQHERPKGEKRRSSWSLVLPVLGVLAIVIIVPLWLLQPRATTYQVRTYQTAVVQTGVLTEFVRGAGTLVPSLERQIVAPVDGTITEWLVTAGDEVSEGSVLGTIDAPDLRRTVSQSETALTQAERRLEQTTLEHQHTERDLQLRIEEAQRVLDSAVADLAHVTRLNELGVVARVEFEAAHEAVAAAERALQNARDDQRRAHATHALQREEASAALAEARVARDLVQQRLVDLELRAPFTSRVIDVATGTGESVRSGEALLTLAATEELRVRAEFGETQARRIAVGQAATLRIAGVDHAGTVEQVAQQAHTTPEGPMVRVLVSLTERPADLRLGTSAMVEVEVGRIEDATYLPRGAYLSTGGERMAYVVSADGDTAYRVPVIFGLIDGNLVQVRDGLQAGQRVITSSYEAYREHEEVHLATGGEIP